MAMAYPIADYDDVPQQADTGRGESKANETEDGSKKVATNPPAEVDTDESEPYPTILIPASELEHGLLGSENEEDEGPIKGLKPTKKESWIKRHLGHSRPKHKVYEVRMSKDEYECYFAKDPETGEYCEGVVEPPGGRKEWVMQRLEEQKSLKPAKNPPNSSAGGLGGNVASAPTNISGASGLG
jgi:hypothetical protein